ncbi:MAG: xanthine dehydrogenase family protein molybdopterin-binding subunit [Desulfobacteraceae bacterium]|nr:xanthine dehydrogenase family protein molybdopterin-binding subunit [Desulfobacteraceae bacterium]
MSEYSVVGKRLPRVDALEKVTGEAVFSVDVSLPNMIHGKVLRSPHAHAAVVRLDVTKARTLDGVLAVVTASDVPGYKNRGELSFTQLPHLARDKVVYAGQPVAAVAAVSVEIAEKALDLIEIDYEELPPVLDPLEATQPSSPLVHDILRTNIITDSQPDRDDKRSNVAYHFKINKGDLEAGFNEADIILENTYRTQKVNHGFIEPFAAVASVDKAGKVTVWTHSQGLFTARQMIAHFLALPTSQVKLVPVEIGGGFGGKTYQPVAPLCGLLAMKSGRPVRMEMTRDEVIKDSRPAAESIVTIKMGVTRKGLITAASASLIYDSGAYPEMSHGMFTSGNVLCQYKIPNVSIDTKDVLTNKVPSAYYRAPATPQAHFAMESHLDIIAETLDMNPLQLRILNAAEEGDTQPNGEVFSRVGFKETLERMVDYLQIKGKLEGKNRGRGIACGFWHGGSGGFGVYINVNNDGSVNLVLGVTDISGSRTSIAQIVAEELGLPLDQVKVVIGDTETGPWGSNSVGSLTVYSLSTAAYRACQDVKAQLSSLAAKRFEVDPSEIEFSKGLFQVKANTEKSISFTDLARSTAVIFGKGPVLGRGTLDGMPPAPTLSVHAVDVEVDDETGKVRVISYAVAQDVGRAINPLSIEGQIQGAVTQGIGWALMEEYIFEKGVVQNTTLLDYRMPTATDVPMIDVMIVEVPSPRGVYGLRHVGEPPMVPTLAAVANAVYNATGVRFKELPMTPEVVLNGMKQHDET